jgi:hypothetical protein
MSIFKSNTSVTSNNVTSDNDSAIHAAEGTKAPGKRGRPAATKVGSVLTNGGVLTRIDGEIHLFGQYINSEGDRVFDDIILRHGGKKKDKLTLVTVRAGVPIAELESYKKSLKAESVKPVEAPVEVEIHGIQDKTDADTAVAVEVEELVAAS